MRRALVDSLAGAISGGISRTVTSPLDVIKIRFQVPRSPNIAIPFSRLHLLARLLRYSLLGPRPLFYPELHIVRSVGWDHVGEFLGMLVCLGGGCRFGVCILQVCKPSSSADSRLHCLSAAKWGLWVPAAVFVRLYLWFERGGIDQFGNGLYVTLEVMGYTQISCMVRGLFRC